MTDSAYIHIPFCKSKCKYCSFVSFVNETKREEYISALIKDIEKKYAGEGLKTLYFGGGTPSLLDPDVIKRLIGLFNLKSDCEVTLEMNPDDADLDYLKRIYDSGVNRLSMGTQTFDDSTLQLIGRRHTSKQTRDAVIFAQEAGFNNISLDLIYGLPGKNNVINDIETMISLGIQHISTYGLKIEEGSYFYSHKPLNLPDDDAQADMYLLINERFSKAGYKRYEVSNFALPGFESKHNLNYWNNEEYYGFGAAAHGYVNGIRYAKHAGLGEYIKNPASFEQEHLLTQKEKLEEEIFLGFRKEEGINVERINQKFNIDFDSLYANVLKKYSGEFIEKTQSGYKLTLQGVLLSNNILSEFI